MLKQELLQSRAGTLTYKKYINNIQIVPSPATISITTESGTAMPTAVTDAAMAIDSYGTMTYEVTAVNTADLGINFIAEIKYTYGGVEYIYRFLFDIVKNVLTSIITDLDLENDYQKLKQLYRTIYGEITAVGNLNEVIDTRNLNETLSYYVGSEIKMLSGNNKDFNVNIIAFDESNRKITLQKAASVAMVIEDKYMIEKSYTNEIQRAFEEISDWLRTRGYRPALIIDDTQVREVHIACTIAKILHAMGKAERAEYEDYNKKYLQLREEMKLIYDTDESGEPEDSDSTRPQVTFSR